MNIPLHCEKRSYSQSAMAFSSDLNEITEHEREKKVNSAHQLAEIHRMKKMGKSPNDSNRANRRRLQGN